MAPGFLSKFSSHGRERSRSSTTPRSSRAISRGPPEDVTASSSSILSGPRPPLPAINTVAANDDDKASTTSTQPNVTVIPPSPRSHTSHSTLDSVTRPRSLSTPATSTASVSIKPTVPASAKQNKDEEKVDKTRTISMSVAPDSKIPQQPTSSAGSESKLVAVKAMTLSPVKPKSSPRNSILELPFTLRRSASKQSMHIDIDPSPLPPPSAPQVPPTALEDSAGSSTNIVGEDSTVYESPTGETLPSPPTIARTVESDPTTNAIGSVTPSASARPSVEQTPSSPESLPSKPRPPPRQPPQLSREQLNQKTPWTRTRRPTGLASAIAGAGFAMAVSPALTSATSSQLSSGRATISSPEQTSKKRHNTSAVSANGNGNMPYLNQPAPRSTSTSSVQSSRNRSGSSQAVHHHSRTTSVSSRAKAGKPRRSTDKSPRTKTMPDFVPVNSGIVNGNTDKDGNAQEVDVEYYSDDDESLRSLRHGGYSDFDEDEGGREDFDLDDLDLEEDIPVTGFAVASNKRNADFHELFPTVPEGDYLIEDYGCALQREILIQGRVYISENHMCFHANIFGWVTDLIVPIPEITSIEKRMTAFVIPNAILVTTRQAKYQFASFLARDTTFDVLYNVWRIARPDNVGLSGEQLLTGPAGAVTAASTPDAVPVDGGTLPKVTKCLCGTPNHPAHYKEVALETVIPGTPETIYNLMFTSGFIKEFLVKDQKLMDLQMSDWTPTVSGSKLLTRSMSYIKPLYSTVGPSKTKCEITDEVLHADSAQCMTLLTTTRTPDVPSGGVFAVKTLTCVTWASTVSSRVSVTTEVEWSGRSFIRSIIERSCIDGQRTHHVALEKAMRAYIQAHQSEFLPEGVDASAITPAEPSLIANKPSAPSAEKEPSEERAEGTGRGLQWAYDTLEGAYKVGSASAAGAIELLGDAWRSSTLTTVLYFVIVLLVISNIWTLKRVGKSEERGRRAERVRQDEHERWLQGVMTGLLGEAAYSGSNALPFSRGLAQQQQSQSQPQAVSCPPSTGDWQTDLEVLKGTLDAVEDRLHVIREQIVEAEGAAGAASSTPLSELD